MIFGSFFSSVATSYGDEDELDESTNVKVVTGKNLINNKQQDSAQQQHQEQQEQQQQESATEIEAAKNNVALARQAWQLDRKYTMSEIQSHCSLDDCWMVIFDKVYNITDFVYEHPGGDFILLEYAGRDATHPFLSSRHGSSAYKMLDKYWIGILVDEELYYSNNSSYCSVYSSLSWRSTPPSMEENHLVNSATLTSPPPPPSSSSATTTTSQCADEDEDDDDDDDRGSSSGSSSDQINCITSTLSVATNQREQQQQH